MYRSTDVGNQTKTTQELQRSAPIPSDQSTPPGSRGCSHVTLFHLPFMSYTPIRGGEGWLNSHQPIQSSHWKTTLNIDVPAIDSTTEVLDIRHLDGGKFQPNDTQRSSLEEELEQDYRSGITIIVLQEHHLTRLFCSDHRHQFRIKNVLVGAPVDANITNSTKNDSYPFPHQRIQEIYGPTYYRFICNDNGHSAEEILTHQPSHRYTRYPLTVKEHNMESTEVCEEEFKYQPKLNNSLETNQEPMLSAEIRSIFDIFKVTSMLLMQLKKRRVFELTNLSISLRSCIWRENQKLKP